jgi:hypothetical protein
MIVCNPRQVNLSAIRIDEQSVKTSSELSDESIVMTFLVREYYGSPKKHENSLKFVKIRLEECFDKVLNEEF